MYKATVNGQHNFDIDKNSITDLDKVMLQDGQFHIIRDNKSYNAEILATDIATKTFTIKVEDEVFEVVLKDEYDQLIQQMGLHSGAKKKANNIKAPMPGLVLDILVKEGQQVAEGDSLIILEAMKMENVLKAEADAVIKSVNVNKGQAVNKNAVLLDLE